MATTRPVPNSSGRAFTMTPPGTGRPALVAHRACITLRTGPDSNTVHSNPRAYYAPD